MDERDSWLTPKNNIISGTDVCFNCDNSNNWYAVVYQKDYKEIPDYVQGNIELDGHSTLVNREVCLNANVLYSCEHCGVKNRLRNINYRKQILK